MKETRPPSSPPISDSLMEEETTATTKQHRSPTSTGTLTPSDSLPVEFWNSPFSNDNDTPSYSSHSPMTHIPFDLVVEILCRLPVKFLLQFRCVCKSWNSLISKDHKFVKKHLLLSTNRKHLVTSSWSLSRKELTVMSYSIDSIFTSEAATQLDYSPIDTDCLDRLIASCDGLICFAINKHLAVVWNPSIRKLKRLPSLELPPQYGFTRYAFGYDPFIHNYKVVAVSCYKYGSDVWKTQVQVHTLGTDFWTTINGFSKISTSYYQCGFGIFVGGTVNWLTFLDSNDFNGLPVIVSLHLGKESFQEILLPDHRNPDGLTLDVMRDCLCIFSISDPFCDVWLMKEYGNKESWVKLIHIPNFGGNCFTKILYVSEDDNQVLLVFKENDKLKWVVYNSKNDTIKSLKIQDLSLVKSNVYVESLISP